MIERSEGISRQVVQECSEGTSRQVVPEERSDGSVVRTPTQEAAR